MEGPSAPACFRFSGLAQLFTPCTGAIQGLVDPHSCGFLDATGAIQELVGPHSCGFLDATLSYV